MKKESNLTLGISEPTIVETYMNKLEHPLFELVQYLRTTILSIDKSIGEGIYWNAPTFYYTGEMQPFNPKDYKRYIVGFVFNRQDCIRLVFLKGANATDRIGILEGDYKDGRRLVTFKSIDEVKSKEAAFKDIIQQLLQLMG